MDKHASNILAKAGSDLFALKTLRNHGLDSIALSQVCRATLIAKLAYASPAWRSFCSVSDLSRLESVEQKARRWGFYSNQASTITDILNQADKGLFQKFLQKSDHVLHPMLPPIKATVYCMRTRGQNGQLSTKSGLTSQNFIIRMLYSSI